MHGARVGLNTVYALESLHGERLITAEAFYCPKCDAIVRGKNEHERTKPDGTKIITGFCSLCNTKVKKTIRPETEWREPAPPENVTPAMKKAAIEEYDRLQAQLVPREEELAKYIMKLYEADPEFGIKLTLDPLDVARLKDDTGYERLLRKQLSLQWAIVPVVELID